MSEVYCRTCEDDNYDHTEGEFVRIPKDRLDSPAILTNVTHRKGHRSQFQRNISSNFSNVNRDLKVLELSQQTAAETRTIERTNSLNRNSSEEYEVGDDVMTSDEILNANTDDNLKNLTNTIDTNELIRVRGKEELPVTSDKPIECIGKDTNEWKNTPANENPTETVGTSQNVHKQMPKKVICTNDHPLMTSDKDNESKIDFENSNMMQSMVNTMTATPEKVSILKRMHRMYSTLPKIKRNTKPCDTSATAALNRPPYSIPTRTTPDGTTIYYLCDLSKNVIKGVNHCFH